MGLRLSSERRSGDGTNYQQITDSVYELYKPNPPAAPELDVVFFHGVQVDPSGEAFCKSWTSQTNEGEVLWPKTWLAERFPTARVASISYDSWAGRSATTGRQDLDSLAELLASDITYIGDYGQELPVVLVGHSLGGLVIKKILLWINWMVDLADDWKLERSQKFLKNVKGIFYYATPHHGSNLTSLSNMIYRSPSPLLKVLEVLSTETARLNHDFRLWRQGAEVKAFSICESCPIRILNMDCLVVTEASARSDTDLFMVVGANHFDVVKPKSRHENSFRTLMQFIDEVTEGTRQGGPRKTMSATPVDPRSNFSLERSLDRVYSNKDVPVPVEEEV